MHGLLAAKIRRRTRFLAAAFAVAAAVLGPGLALAGPAQASTASGKVSVTINTMNPQYATAGATVNLTGAITNGTRQAQAGLEVQLVTSATRFSSRDQMDSYLAHGTDSALLPAGRPFTLPASVAPGAVAHWSASFQVSAEGITEFGVYPVAALVQDDISGALLASDQTLLPFWPGQRAAGLLRPLNLSWTWPLIDQPHSQVCTALSNNSLAASLKPGGRLSALLSAGTSHPAARLTWIIDPALLSDMATMARPYQAGGKANCIGASSERASPAAANWLSALKKATGDQTTVITPFANVDMAALVHQGLTTDLAAAYRTGDQVAQSVLGETFQPVIAVPPGGTADLSLLTNLAAAEHIGTVVLSSSEMPPSNPAVFSPDDAVTSTHTAVGTPMSVLLADDTLTRVLASGDTTSGASSPGRDFAVEQRFLAETAMIAAEAPDTARSIVVAPPENWSPSATLAGGLLSQTTSAPWLKPTPLTSLSSAPDTEHTLSRQQPPDSKASPGELSRGYLAQVSQRDAQLKVFRSMLYHPSRRYLQSFDETLAATESAAWRGRARPRGLALVGNLGGYLRNAERKVTIIASAQVPMGGSSGQVPISIENGLRQQVIAVTVIASPVNSLDRPSQLTVGRLSKVVLVAPGQAVLVRLHVSSAPQGSTLIRLGLASAGGTRLHFADTQLIVVSTRYGRAILFLVGSAIGVLVLTSVYRGGRRRLRDHAQLVSEEADPPGSVVTGSSARHPTEAPDDLADARRWVDDA